MTRYKKAPAAKAGANRRSDVINSASESSTWDRNLQDRMNQSGAPRGERNIEMVKLACDIVWAGDLTESELFDFLRNRYENDLKDYEIRSVLRWAYSITTPRTSKTYSYEYRKTRPHKQLIEWNGGTASDSLTKSFQRSFRRAPRPVNEIDGASKELVIPALDKGSIEELTKLRVSRGLPCFAALEILYDMGMFGFCHHVHKGSETRCWILSDPAGKNAQVRPLEPEKAGWHFKAKSLPGSDASWPIGAACIENAEIVLISEGTTDLLAAATGAWWESNRKGFNKIGFACMTGASQSISSDALPRFADKRVRIFVHNDEAGRKAAVRWWQQLDPYAAHISAWMSDREGEDLNDVIRRCWDEMPENQTQWLPEKLLPDNKTPAE
jgi:hypothetical protein